MAIQFKKIIMWVVGWETLSFKNQEIVIGNIINNNNNNIYSYIID